MDKFFNIAKQIFEVLMAVFAFINHRSIISEKYQSHEFSWVISTVWRVTPSVSHPWQTSYMFTPYYRGLHPGRKVIGYVQFPVYYIHVTFSSGKQPSEYSDKYNLESILLIQNIIYKL